MYGISHFDEMMMSLLHTKKLVHMGWLTKIQMDGQMAELSSIWRNFSLDAGHTRVTGWRWVLDTTNMESIWRIIDRNHTSKANFSSETYNIWYPRFDEFLRDTKNWLFPFPCLSTRTQPAKMKIIAIIKVEKLVYGDFTKDLINFVQI